MSFPRDEEHQSTPLSKACAASTPELFVEALGELKCRSLRSFTRIASAGLPRSTAHHIVTQKTLPTRREQVVLFAMGCGEASEQAELWAVEWDRLAAAQPSTAVRQDIEQEQLGLVEPRQTVEPRAAREFDENVTSSASMTSRIFLAALVVQLTLVVLAIHLLG